MLFIAEVLGRGDDIVKTKPLRDNWFVTSCHLVSFQRRFELFLMNMHKPSVGPGLEPVRNQFDVYF
jgi:hypothetical protein